MDESKRWGARVFLDRLDRLKRWRIQRNPVRGAVAAPAMAHALAAPLDRIALEPPQAAPRWTLWIVVALFAVLLVWATFARLDVVTVAEGRLVPQTLVKIVQPAEGGVIGEILVKEGDAVKTGQVLIRLNTDLVDAERRSADGELQRFALSLRRIDAELAGQPMQRREDDDAELFRQVKAQYVTRRQTYEDTLAQEHAAWERTTHELTAARQILQKLRETVPVYQETAASYGDLAKEGYVAALAAKEKQRESIEKEQELKAQEATVKSLESALLQTRKRMERVQSGYRGELQDERIRNEQAMQMLREKQEKSVYRAALHELRAPQDGIVKDLATTTIGAVVQPGTVLINLVPQEEALVAEVRIRNEDVGFLAPGLPVRLKLAAFPFTRYGMIEGHVAQIGADATEQTAASAPGTAPVPPSYRARVVLKTQQLQTPSGELLTIAPGMLVAAEIRQRQRTVLEYLLSPVEKIVREAGRER